MRLTRTHIPILLAAALLIGAAVTAVLLVNSPSPAQAAAAALEESSAEVRSALSDDLGPDRPLVIVTDTFQRGGFKTAYDADDWTRMAIYDEQVTWKVVITTDASGMAVDITNDIANLDGSQPIVENLLDGTRTVAPTGNTGADNVEEPWDVAKWLDAQLALPRTKEEDGFEYVGRFELDGQPSIRYEHREKLGVLPNGQVFDPPIVAMIVLEFVEANPLLVQESHYVVQADGASTLEYRKTVTSVSAGERPSP